MVELVWGSVGAEDGSELFEVSGIFAMNEQVSSAIIIPNSDCLVTVARSMSDNFLHLAFFWLENRDEKLHYDTKVLQATRGS